MFLGHYALGFAAKKIDNRPSLGTMLMAAQFIDLLWPLFLIIGMEEVRIDPGNTAITPLNFIHYPWSHSLTASIGWALLFGAVYYFTTKNKKGALILSALVISHWLLDFIAHRPDLPLDFSETKKLGLGLWNNPAMTMLAEGALFLSGIIIYPRSTKARNKKGTILLWSFIILIVVLYILSVFGPVPESVSAIKYSAMGQWLFIAWAYWIDRNRTAI